MQAAPLIPYGTPRRLSRSEYERIAELGLFRDERVELIHGIVVRMAPIGPPHSDVVDRLSTLLIQRLANRARIRTQQPFVAIDESEPEPDVAVVPPVSYSEQHPSQAYLIIEVAESSLDYDRETKAPLYAASGVAEYWIVDIGSRTIHVFNAPAEGGYNGQRSIAADGRLTLAAFPGVEVAVSELFD